MDTNKKVISELYNAPIKLINETDIDSFIVFVPDNSNLTKSFSFEEDARQYYNKLFRTNPEVKSLMELRILYIDGRVETILKEKK